MWVSHTESGSLRRAFKLGKLRPPCEEQGKLERRGGDGGSGEGADDGCLEARSAVVCLGL